MFSHIALLCCCFSDRITLVPALGLCTCLYPTWTLSPDILLAHNLTIVGLSLIITSSVRPSLTPLNMSSPAPTATVSFFLHFLQHVRSSIILYLRCRTADVCFVAIPRQCFVHGKSEINTYLINDWVSAL